MNLVEKDINKKCIVISCPFSFYFYRLYFAFGTLRVYRTRSCFGLFSCARVQPLRAVAALLSAGAPRRCPCPIAGPIRRAALPVVASSSATAARRVCARLAVPSLYASVSFSCTRAAFPRSARRSSR